MRTGSISALSSSGFHRLVYHEWGSVENDRVVVCVHGLARNSRDFDDLAQALARDYRVVCPDIAGRGHSDWLSPASAYQIPQYMNDMAALLARLNIDKVDWVGTSMGGLIGICLAALPNSPIRSLLLNDIGPFVPRAALQRIADYLEDRRFDSIEACEAWLRQTYPALGSLSASQWRRLAQTGTRMLEDGSLALHYDPAIAENLRLSSDEDVDLWELWQQIRCPQMLIWGEASDVLLADTVARMGQENPAMQLLSLPGIAHAPSLMDPPQIEAVVAWLRSHQHR
ncbi:alpha/beta fold hydrolase [Marinobacterium rhizophilum]|uniref:Alpha/beta hydrolase n=1 Tax=Marinobacterium rhizophilum TaxID=420402 RepID=A0ABY5HGV1_9GAMM|nr:alpha/beta hydrolase [Marinobacterium rhizophilum]UTW11593.1 alpha/beta hydrolase [Marinobacterium rhizophilum]